MFLPEWWHQGFALESISAVLLHALTELCLPFVVAETQSKNVRSIRLLEKLGFQFVEHVERFNALQAIYSVNKNQLM